MQSTGAAGRILTFYSYKGGTGRSMALANVAWILACQGKRVLAIDWDLEAPGLHRYFRPFLIDEDLTSSEGLIDLVDAYATEAIRPWESNATPPADWYLVHADFTPYVLSLNFPHFPEGGKIDLLPAGRQGDAYALTVSSFNWQNFYDRLGGGGFIDAFAEKARSLYDYVLIDSRTGVSDTAGICSVQLPDTLVLCFTYNNQSIKGAAAVARSAIQLRSRLSQEKLARLRSRAAADAPLLVIDTPPPFRVFPAPMRVDSGESDRLAVRQAFARETFAEMVAHVGQSEIAEYWSSVEVPQRVLYSYEEVLAPFKDDPLDPKSLLAAFVRMTRYLVHPDTIDYRLPISPEAKQKYLDAFAATPLTAKAKPATGENRTESDDEALVRTAEVAIAALNDRDRAIAKRIFSRLVRLGREEEGGGFFPIRSGLSEFSDEERLIIDQLTRYGVLAIVTETRASTQTPLAAPEHKVALADERLLKLWKTLRTWLEADREFLLWRQGLRGYVADWQRSGADAGARLSGRLLSEADLWALRRGADLNAAEHEYIETSRRAPSALGTVVPAQPSASTGSSGKVLAPSRRRRLWVAAALLGALIVGGFLLLNRPGQPVNGPASPTEPPAGTIGGGGAAPPALVPPGSGPAGPAGRTPAAADVESLIAQGDGFFAAGNTIAAQAAYAKALALDPRNSRAYAGLGRVNGADQSTQGRVVLHYGNRSDTPLVERVRNQLASSLRPLVLPAAELTAGRTVGDIRYFFREDEKLAQRVKSAVEFALEKEQRKLNLAILFRDAANFPKAERGTVEVWLPAFSMSSAK